MLAKLLSLLAADLRLPQYVHHYWRDFPDLCPANPDVAITGQLSENFLTGLNAPVGMRETPPPNIHQVWHGQTLADKTKPVAFTINILRS